MLPSSSRPSWMLWFPRRVEELLMDPRATENSFESRVYSAMLFKSEARALAHIPVEARVMQSITVSRDPLTSDAHPLVIHVPTHCVQTLHDSTTSLNISLDRTIRCSLNRAQVVSISPIEIKSRNIAQLSPRESRRMRNSQFTPMKQNPPRDESRLKTTLSCR